MHTNVKINTYHFLASGKGIFNRYEICFHGGEDMFRIPVGGGEAIPLFPKQLTPLSRKGEPDIRTYSLYQITISNIAVLLEYG
jgi:hypothetical protein